jgi:hypothetical protein
MANQPMRAQLDPSRTRPTGEVPLWARPSLGASEQAFSDLLNAFELLNRRGTGAAAWAAPFLDDPVAFLLDTMSDAMNVWNADGQLLYQNRAAVGLGLGCAEAAPLEEFYWQGRRFERRCLCYRLQGVEYVLEILHEV